MLKSVLKSACRSGLRPALGPWAAACLPWALPIIALPIIALPIIALPMIVVPILAVPSRSLAAESIHCLSGDEQRAASANGKTVPLATVIHTLRRAPKDVIKAQLCQEPDHLVYRLTLLGRDGKVKRATVDAINGSVVGER